MSSHTTTTNTNNNQDSILNQSSNNNPSTTASMKIKNNNLSNSQSQHLSQSQSQQQQAVQGELRSFTNPHPISSNEIEFDISKRRKGTCKFFNSQKGFGFINDDHPQELGNQEVFVHYTSIGSKGGFRSLAEGEEVEYVLSPGQKGFQANEVTGPSGKAVQGDAKSKIPKTPTFVPYPMGIMPGGYAIAGTSTPYMHQDPYMAAAGHPNVYGSPYGSQVFYVPSTVGIMPTGHSPNLGGMSPYPSGTPGAHTSRSPTIPITHHPSPMAMTLASPQPNGFGFGNHSMSYGLAASSSNALGSGTGGIGVVPGGESRSPGLGVHNLGFANQASPSFRGSGSGTGGGGGGVNHSNQDQSVGLGIRSDLNSHTGSNMVHRGGGGGGSGSGSRSEDRHGGSGSGGGGGGGGGNHSIGPNYQSHHHHHPHHHHNHNNQNGSSSLLYTSNNPAAYQ